MSQFVVSGSRFVTQNVNEVNFWTSGIQFLTTESQFPGNKSRFLACGRRIFALVMDF